MKETLFILTIITLQTITKSRFCKFLKEGYYNYEQANFGVLSKQITKSITIFATFCDDKAGKDICGEEAPGNVFYKFKGSERCYTVSKASKSKNEYWNRNFFNFEDIKDFRVIDDTLSDKNNEKIQNINSQAISRINSSIIDPKKNLENSLFKNILYKKQKKSRSILLTHEISQGAELQKSGFFRVHYALLCDRSKSESTSRLLTNGTDLLFYYQGREACPIELLEATVFLKRHKSFSLTLGCLALASLLLLKRFERASMALIGFEIGLFLVVLILAELESHFHLEDNHMVIFVLGATGFGLIVATVCSFIKEVGVFLAVGAASLSTTFTISCLFVLISNDGIKEIVFWSIFVVVMILMALPSFNKRFFVKYALSFYSSIAQPFFVLYSTAVYFDIYPEPITMKEAVDYGRIMEPRIENWGVLGLQMISSFAAYHFLSGGIQNAPTQQKKDRRSAPTFSFVKKLRDETNYSSMMNKDGVWEGGVRKSSDTGESFITNI